MKPDPNCVVCRGTGDGSQNAAAQSSPYELDRFSFICPCTLPAPKLAQDQRT